MIEYRILTHSGISVLDCTKMALVAALINNIVKSIFWCLVFEHLDSGDILWQ